MGISSAFFINNLFEILVPVGIIILTLICGFIIGKIVFVRLSYWSKQTKTQIDDIVIDSIMLY
ncbi:MAG: hypothetical protein PHC29_01650 [Candidatus Omnitrophica bacterium]|nr:hypothetical protein [Candidatus Omnitrophota bacterium]